MKKNETDPDWAENILWAEDSLHLQMAWLAGYANLMTDRYYAGDINGENDQIEGRTPVDITVSCMQIRIFVCTHRLCSMAINFRHA